MFNRKGYKLLGCRYKGIFSVGEYIEWRRIVRDRDYEAKVSQHYGIIIDLLSVDTGGRDVWYAKVMENGGLIHLILLSQIRKKETN